MKCFLLQYYVLLLSLKMKKGSIYLLCELQIDQPTLGLPSRDYYLHPESQRDLQVYFEYMTDVAVIIGANRTDAESQLWDVIELEIKLANVSMNTQLISIYAWFC
jgi:predicted metalloendopeptidase